MVGEEKQLKNTSFDLKDYIIIKEGEVEILMHPTNQVFYNKAQVNNRDMSIAVLRTFISQRKLEHEAMLARQAKAEPKVPDESVSEMEPPADSVQHNGISSDGCELLEEMSRDEQCSISDVQIRNLRRKDLELKPARVLEALSASGLSDLRYAREVEGIGQVVALDNDKASVEAFRRNIRFNGSVAADARVYMLTHPKEFDVLDLDPYGSPSVFLDSAVQSVVDGGILMCTATDLAVLCGGSGEVCYSKYGSYPLREKYCHEMALRILLACIESHANRYKRYIVPVLSVDMDFYVRVFVRIYSSASAMKSAPLKLSYVYQCTGCDSFHLQPVGRTISKVCVQSKSLLYLHSTTGSAGLRCSNSQNGLESNSLRYHPGFGPPISQDCSDCGKKFNMGGPIWSAPIHDQEWVAAILADGKSMKERYPAYDRICAILTAVSEELPDIPLFLSLHKISATLKCTSPSAVMFRSAVINAGYRTSGTHVKNHPVKAQPSHCPGSVILAKEPVLQANFARAVASPGKAKDKKVARFLPNTERHWGPKLRAGRQITGKPASLFGTKAVNVFSNLEDSDKPAAERKKTEDPDS